MKQSFCFNNICADCIPIVQTSPPKDGGFVSWVLAQNTGIQIITKSNNIIMTCVDHHSKQVIANFSVAIIYDTENYRHYAQEQGTFFQANMSV